MRSEGRESGDTESECGGEKGCSTRLWLHSRQLVRCGEREADGCVTVIDYLFKNN